MNGTWQIKPRPGRGELYAACIGGAAIKVEIPGHGGFTVECTGVASGASLPTLGATVHITHVTNQKWRVAVFGR